MCTVSIHAPVRGATSDHATPQLSSSFNPRARTGRDDQGRARCHRLLMFQSTRPYGARRNRTRCARASSVSIHAPVRGATAAQYMRRFIDVMFQSTRPYGARHATLLTLRLRSASFNPRARTGRDAEAVRSIWHYVSVSIHAPVRGATCGSVRSAAVRGVSIHAPVRGATSDAASVRQMSAWFQSTRPYGARRAFG